MGVCLNVQRGLSAVHLAVLCKRYKTLNALLSSELVDINLPSTNVSSWRLCVCVCVCVCVWNAVQFI